MYGLMIGLGVMGVLAAVTGMFGMLAAMAIESRTIALWALTGLVLGGFLGGFGFANAVTVAHDQCISDGNTWVDGKCKSIVRVEVNG